MDQPVIDHRGPEFAELTLEVLDGLRAVFKTSGPVVIFPASGTGAAEAALVNTLSPGDRVLIFETGHFSRSGARWPSAWACRSTTCPATGGAAPPKWTSTRGSAPTVAHTIKAVVVVHNETSTGVTSRLADVRRAMNAAGHPALLIVDAVSSLASIDYRHDEWEVDVTVVGSQKGLMLPPGIGFNAISEKALAASQTARLPQLLGLAGDAEEQPLGFFPYTPATNLLYALREALRMLEEEGLDDVFARHDRHGAATRAAVRAWGLEIVCEDPREYSSSMTAFFMPDGSDADRLARDRPRALRHVARYRPVEAGRPGRPHRPSGQLQRPDARRDAERHRNGPAAGRRAAPGRRRDGRSRLSRAGDL